MVNREEPLSIRCQCNLVSVSRGSFYYKPLGESEANLKLISGYVTLVYIIIIGRKLIFENQWSERREYFKLNIEDSL